MTNNNGHGGKRKGAGRKPNLTLYQEIVIGQTCERLLESAALRAFNRRKRDLFEHQTELSHHWESVNKLTLDKRDELIKTELLKYYEDNIEAELKLFSHIKQWTKRLPACYKFPKDHQKELETK